MHTFTAGIGWEFLDKQTLHFNFSHGGIQPRAGTVNEDLQMPTQETRIKYDLGWMGFFRGLGSATVTAFYVDQEDAIELTGQTMNIGGEILELYNNRKQYQYGVEGELRSIRFACGLQGFLNATWMETCYEEDDSDWARDLTMPRFIAGGGLNYVGHHFDASLFVRHVSGFENTRFLPSKSDPAPLGDYIDLGMTLGYSFGPYDNYRAHVRVENMTNDKYSNVVGYPDTGTRFYAGLTFKF